MDFAHKARTAAAAVRAGLITQAEAEQRLGLEPGERLGRTGVIHGSGAHPDIPRFGADENDLDSIPGAQDAGWAAYWEGQPKFRDGE